MSEENKKNFICCKDAAPFLRELDNSQQADPGYRHIRLSANTADDSALAFLRIRFCPWCGNELLEPSAKISVEDAQRLLDRQRARSAEVDKNVRDIRRMCSHLHFDGKSALTPSLDGTGDDVCHTCGAYIS